MKNKGFTLIELLAVILILGVIATITTPSVISVINTSRQKACERQKEMILDAAKRWGSDNAINLSYNQICVDDLKIQGYLSNKDIMNPKTKKEMKNDVCINIKYDEDNNQYEYTYKKDPCSE